MIALFVPLMLVASAFGSGVVDPELPTADVLTPELLACVIGEAGGVGVWETQERLHEAWRLLMHTALNRHLAPGIPGLLDGFYAREHNPPQEAIEMAREVMEADPRDDPTAGCRFALSKQDLELLGIESEGDIMLRGNSVFQLHLYKSWPGG